MRDFMCDEIKNFGGLSTKPDSKRERYVQDRAFQTQKKETMEEGGGAGRNKADLPRYLTKRKTERERYGTYEQTMDHATAFNNQHLDLEHQWLLIVLLLRTHATTIE